MNIGFIGCGNMGTAMINGILQSGLVNAENLIASAKSEETQNKIENDFFHAFTFLKNSFI